MLYSYMSWGPLPGPEKSNRALSWRIDGCMDYFEVQCMHTHISMR